MSVNQESNRELAKAKLWLAEKIEASLAEKTAVNRDPQTIQLIRDRYELARKHARITIPPDQEEAFFEGLVDEIVGFGPLEPLLKDETVTEVMVNRPDLVYIERKGKMVETNVRFVNDGHIERVINKIIKPLGRIANRENPLVDARLPDGSRVNAVVAPCAIDGPNITIRKFSKTPFGIQDLIAFGSLNEDMAEFLRACVISKLNIVVSGGTGSGKTTLLNVLSSFIPDSDRIVTIEDAAELNLSQRHVVRLETKKANYKGDSEVTIRDLVVNSLRMRPERIVVGECRAGEALDMLQAMNTGHDGSLTTVHANTPRDTISRLETLVLMAGMDLPLQVVRRQIVSAINLIVQQERLRDGSRKVTAITELTGLEGETPVMQDIFRFNEVGEKDGKVIGEFVPGGSRPMLEHRLKIYGFTLPASMFMTSGNRAAPQQRRR
jgi:pilus assembly protein CpaF